MLTIIPPANVAQRHVAHPTNGSDERYFLLKRWEMSVCGGVVNSCQFSPGPLSRLQTPVSHPTYNIISPAPHADSASPKPTVSQGGSCPQIHRHLLTALWQLPRSVCMALCVRPDYSIPADCPLQNRKVKGRSFCPQEQTETDWFPRLGNLPPAN